MKTIEFRVHTPNTMLEATEKDNEDRPSCHRSEVMQKADGFTLIELLVVVAIIAILAGLLIPVLSKAKLHATGASCLANQKTLGLSYFMYAEDHNGKLVGPSNGKGQWVESPAFVTAALDVKQQALRDGLLFPYINSVDAYHCPSDRRRDDPAQLAFRSYSGHNGLFSVKLLQEIINPTRKYIFVEDYDPRGYNLGTWSMHDPLQLDKFDWEDPLATWHNNRTTLSFADGHAEKHVWTDGRTVKYFKWVVANSPGWLSSTVSPHSKQGGNRDVIYMKIGYNVAEFPMRP